MAEISLLCGLMPAHPSLRLRELIAVSLERVLTKSGDPSAEDHTVIRHIIDWLMVADQQDAGWIRRVNAQGVPLKLAKCGSLDRLRAEADKAMHRETQRAMARLDPAQAGEGEEIEMTLDDGWTIVRLLTPEALDRESGRMGHCVGNGAYDDEVISEETKIFSLRCPRGKSRVTIEIGKDIQIQGKCNSRPPAEQVDALHALFVKHDKEPEYWYNLVSEQRRGRLKHAEALIRTHPVLAAHYAFFVLRERWPEAEAVIMTNATSAFFYVETIMKKPWPEAEAVIATDPYFAGRYAQDILRRRWPEAEPVIMTDPDAATYYALRMMDKPWPEAEPFILKCPKSTRVYMRHVRNNEWDEALPVIASDPDTAYRYAVLSLNGRWPEAESTILTDGIAAAEYACNVIKGPWIEAEDIIFSTPHAPEKYALMMLQPECRNTLSEERRVKFENAIKEWRADA